MMNGTKNKRTVKGFTIVEMVVVVAIIIILLGVLAPSMMAYYRSSRLKSANADAKMVYNAAQTEVMHYMNKDRVSTDKSGFANNVWIAYQPNVGGKFSDLPAVNAASLKSTTDASGGAIASACNQTIASVNHTVAGASDVCWAVYVNNYIVKSSVSAANTSTNYVGFYSANKQQATETSSSAYRNCYLQVLTSAFTNGYQKVDPTKSAGKSAGKSASN